MALKITFGNALRFFIRALLPVLLLIVGAWLAYKILQSSPRAGRRKGRSQTLQVRVEPLKRSDARVRLRSNGLVQARIQTVLRAERSGQIIKLSEAFRETGFFNKGDLLFALDARQVKINLKRLKGEVTQAQIAYELLKTEYDQLSPQIELLRKQLVLQKQRFERSQEMVRKGVSTEVQMETFKLAEVATKSALQAMLSRYALLKVRQKSAQQALAQARVSVEAAELDLERTFVYAPYTGRILTRGVDIGQFVNAGTELAQIYSTNSVEVVLPLTRQQLRCLDFNFERSGDVAGPEVTLSALGQSWQGRVVRSQGRVDAQTRQLGVVVVIHERARELRLGQFLEGEIEGQELKDVYIIPRSSLRGDTAYLVNKNKLRRARLKPVWANNESIFVKEGLREGDWLSLSTPTFGGDSVAVKMIKPGEKPSFDKPAKGSKKAGAGQAPKQQLHGQSGKAKRGGRSS